MNKLANRLPLSFANKIKEIFPSKWQIIINGLCLKKKTSFRVNRLKSSAREIEERLRALPLKFHKLSYPEDAFVLDVDKRDLQDTDLYKEGKIYIQNISSMLPPLALNLQKGEFILDMCAAPGSKTSQMAGLIGCDGKIIAIEKVKPRFFKLLANLKQQGAQCVEPVLSDAVAFLRRSQNMLFDKILLDAPCSSEGRFSPHSPKSFGYWSEKKVKEMQKKQKRLIKSAIMRLKTGGHLLYSTCTFSPEENELVIDWILKQVDGLIVEKISLPITNAISGLTEYKGRALKQQISRAVRILPNEQMEGFFMCLIRKGQ